MRLRARSIQPVDAGFTLLELLVVMTMVTLVVLAMAGALRTMAQTEARVDERLLRADDFRVVAGFLHSTLGRVSQRRLDPPPPLGENLFLFAAAPDALAWVGVMPARHSAGGRYVFRLALETSGEQSQLVLRFAPALTANSFPDWPGTESRVLAQDVTAFSIAYQDPLQVPPQWLAAWDVPDRLPSRVKLMIQSATGPWPELIIALRTLPTSTRGSGPTFGGGGDGP